MDKWFCSIKEWAPNFTIIQNVWVFFLFLFPILKVDWQLSRSIVFFAPCLRLSNVATFIRSWQYCASVFLKQWLDTISKCICYKKQIMFSLMLTYRLPSFQMILLFVLPILLCGFLVFVNCLKVEWKPKSKTLWF